MTVPSHDTPSPVSIILDLSADAWHNEVVPRLPANLEAKARDLHVIRRVQRVRGLTCATDLIRALLAYVLGNFSERAWGAWAVTCGLADLSATAWRNRLRQANPLLAWLLATLIATTPPQATGTPRRRVRLIDATRLRQVGGTGDDWRVHLAYTFDQACLDDVIVTDQHRAECLAHFDIQAGDILVADAAYGYRTHVDTARRAGADVVTRVHLPSFPLEHADGTPFDALAWVRQQHTTVAAWAGWCRAQGRRHAVRLVISKLPTDKAAAARHRKQQKARKAQRRLQPQTVFLAGWVCLITTLDATWTITEVLRLYRARWQIELLFKRLKQHLRVSAIRSHTRTAVEATVRALLIAWALQEQASGDLRALLPHADDEERRPVSSWVLATLHVATLRSQVLGELTEARLRDCLPRLRRFLCDSPRGRIQQEAALRRWLGARLDEPALEAEPAFQVQACVETGCPQRKAA